MSELGAFLYYVYPTKNPEKAQEMFIFLHLFIVF